MRPVLRPATLLARAGLLLALGSVVALAADAQPKKKDSPERMLPKQATFKAAISPAEARSGDVVTYTVTANIDPPWHIYTYSKTQLPPGQGPRHTQFDLFQTAGLVPDGDWMPSRPPHEQAEPAFGNKVFGSYEGEVAWSLKLRVPPGTSPGEKAVRSQVFFQICDPKSCSPLSYKSLPPVVLTVLPGGVAAAAVPPAPAGDTGPALTTAPTTTATAPAQLNVAEQKIREGLLPFLLFSALGGLAALVMPCVWPMVPVTVNFFVKQGQSGQARTTRLAIVYCLAIIGIFTAVGVLFSAFVSAASLQRLANTAWLNLTVAFIFLAFGLSLLGLFEIRLPTSLLNASARGEGRGGLVGVIFMALTLTITSFTCTFPVVGGLLVVASQGSYFYPVIGLATFATVLALPFFLLALAPGLLRSMPRSGDWMNAVKIVGGLVEIGAAFKFLNTAEIALGAVPDSAWFDAQVVLSIWVVLAAVSGLYLLGVFRTDHDHGTAGVGPVRILTGSGFLFFALYMAPALFGAPPQSRVYNLFVGLMPPDVDKFNRLMLAGPSGPRAAEKVSATSTDPAEAERQEKLFHGVEWGLSYAQALERAKAENRPVLIDFTGVNCANCRQMEQEVMPRSEIRAVLEKFVTVAQYTDYVPIASLSPEQREELARANQSRQFDLVRDVTTPLYVVVTPEGQVLGSSGGYIPAAQYKTFLEGLLQKYEAVPRVARAE